MSSSANYPIAHAALRELLQASPSSSSRSTSSSPADAAFALGPSVLRAPPPLARPVDAAVAADLADGDWGAIVEDVYVAEDGGEVHLVFRAEVLGGMRLCLQKRPEGLHGRFIVADAAAERAWQPTIDALLRRMDERGKGLVSHSVESG